MKETVTRSCRNCYVDFSTKRRHAQTCSAKCRQAYKRKFHERTDTAPQRGSTKMLAWWGDEQFDKFAGQMRVEPVIAARPDPVESVTVPEINTIVEVSEPATAKKPRGKRPTPKVKARSTRTAKSKGKGKKKAPTPAKASTTAKARGRAKAT